MLELEKAKQLINSFDNIDILPSADLKADSFPAALALYYSLRKLGKNVNLVVENEPETYAFLVEKEKLQPAHRADFLIAIKEKNLKLSQLFYEKTNQGLNIFLKTGGQINKNNVSFKPMNEESIDPEEDNLLVIALGMEDLKLISQSYQPLPQIIYLNQQTASQDLGQINLIESSAPSLSEIVFDLICFIDESLIDQQVANSLLTGIIEQVAESQNLKLSSSTFHKLNCLLEKGADLKLITNNLYDTKHRNSVRVLGKVLSKIQIEEKNNLAWVMLQEKDFCKINSSPLDLKFTLNKLNSGLFSFANFLCLWEQTNSPTEVLGIFYSLDKNMLEKITGHYQGKTKGQGLLFKAKTNDLEIAQKEFFKLI